LTGPAGATVYVRANLETNIGTPCSTTLSSLSSGWSPHVIPGSGTLCLGGGSPLQTEFANVGFEASYTNGGPAQATLGVGSLKVRIPCWRSSLPPGGVYPANSIIEIAAHNIREGVQVRLRYSDDNGATWSFDPPLAVPTPPSGQATKVVLMSDPAPSTITVTQVDPNTLRLTTTSYDVLVRVEYYAVPVLAFVTAQLCPC
jgi:hypothetical protein